MKICPKCKIKCDDNVRFCINCGENLPETLAQPEQPTQPAQQPEQPVSVQVAAPPISEFALLEIKKQEKYVKIWKYILFAVLAAFFVPFIIAVMVTPDPGQPIEFDKNKNTGEYAFILDITIADYVQRTTVNDSDNQRFHIIESNGEKYIAQLEKEDFALIYGYGKPIPADVIAMCIRQLDISSAQEFHEIFGTVMFVHGKPVAPFYDTLISISAGAVIAFVPVFVIFLSVKWRLKTMKKDVKT
jgi:hypothetical protein